MWSGDIRGWNSGGHHCERYRVIANDTIRLAVPVVCSMSHVARQTRRHPKKRTAIKSCVQHAAVARLLLQQSGLPLTTKVPRHPHLSFHSMIVLSVREPFLRLFSYFCGTQQAAGQHADQHATVE
jgi:hypothetical protein